jgi:hypothetical protein
MTRPITRWPLAGTQPTFQVQGRHTYQDSLDLVRTRLRFLTATDRDWLLRRTAADFFFRT